DPDPDQVVERVEAGPLLRGDASEDPPDRQPGDPHQLADRPLRALAAKPSHLVVKAAREAGVVTRPRHRRHNNAVAPAATARRLRLQIAAAAAEIERPPAPSPLTPVVAGA